MTAPAQLVREQTYIRDNRRCVSCGATEGLQWNHRESSGHGGRGSKAPAVTSADGVTSCWDCNPRYESDLQTLALSMGWKLKRNRRLLSSEIPYYDSNDRTWYLPGDGSARTRIIAALAQELIAAAGGLQVA